MTYIPDGEPCSYYPGLFPPEVRTVAIGWLDAVHPYRVGPVDPECLRLLKEANPAVATMGLYRCELCLAKGLRPEVDSSDLVVVAPDGTWYVTPNMIVHYVSKHAYSPPDEFVAAVLSGRFLHFFEWMPNSPAYPARQARSVGTAHRLARRGQRTGRLLSFQLVSLFCRTLQHVKGR